MRLLEAALSKDMSARAELLDGISGVDPDLREDLEAFLASSPTRSDGDEPAPAPAADSPTRARPSASEKPRESGPRTERSGRVGPYHILRDIGEGGMGVVY